MSLSQARTLAICLALSVVICGCSAPKLGQQTAQNGDSISSGNRLANRRTRNAAKPRPWRRPMQAVAEKMAKREPAELPLPKNGDVLQGKIAMARIMERRDQPGKAEAGVSSDPG